MSHPTITNKVTYTVTLNATHGYDVHLGATAVSTGTVDPHSDAHKHARANYPAFTVVELTMPLKGGGTKTESLPPGYGWTPKNG